ncbi:P-loop NTPase fold protein [Vibrio sp. C8]
MATQVTHIINILSDNSFPPALLFDGDWGSGKSHFIRNELLDALKYKFEMEVVFFSLYGIDSIDDFRDRLISEAYGSVSEKGQDRFLKLIEGASQLSGQNGVGAIVGGLVGLYKHQIYKEINNRIFILDDLERVTDKNLIKQILGECLEFAENKKCKVIVIANEKKLSCQSDIEKIFVDKCYHSLCTDEMISILNEYHPEIISDFNFCEQIKIDMNHLKSKNLRVIKRALNKFGNLNGFIDEDYEIEAKVILLSQIMRLSYLLFEKGYSVEDICRHCEKNQISIAVRKQLLLEKKEFSEEDRLEDDIVNTLNRPASEILVMYCASKITDDKYVFDCLDLPKVVSEIDKALSYPTVYQMTDEEFESAYRNLIEFVKGGKDVYLDKWFSALDRCIYFIDNKFILATASERESLIKLGHDLDMDRFIVPNDMTMYRRHDMVSLENDELKELYRVARSNLIKKVDFDSDEKFKFELINSLNSVRDEFYNKFVRIGLLNLLSIDEFMIAFFKWSPIEIRTFCGYLDDEFVRGGNIDDTQKSIAIELREKLINEMEGINPSVRLGGLNLLVSTLDEVIDIENGVVL